jgi:CRISPR-associated endonuclease Cas1/CRISPR-associated protein Cas4
MSSEELPLMPVRRLHNYAYCPRLFYYQWVEGIFVENADTVDGTLLHARADKPGRMTADLQGMDLPEGTVLRSLQLENASLGLTGKIDICEQGPDGVEIIDYKKGSSLRDGEGTRVAKHADAIQVGAYALLLKAEGMKVAGASIYYSAERRRVKVELDDHLFEEIRSLYDAAIIVAREALCPPPLKGDPRCLHCSAYPVCLPSESAWWADDEATPPHPAVPPRPESGDGEVLVVQDSRAKVGLRGDQVVVERGGETLAKLPLNQIRSLYLYGVPQLSSQLIHALLEREIGVSYFSAAGRFLGMLGGLPASGVDARRGQYRMFEQPEIRLILAKESLRSKIHNQRVMLMRNGDVPEGVIETMAGYRKMVEESTDLEVARGIEGAAAALYFSQFPTMIKDCSWARFAFEGRNRRPPRDPVNAMLSLGYSVLAKEVAGICHSVGLDPFLGFLHQPRYGRPALALDLMEEFRPLIADSVAISILNRREISESDFISTTSGTFLNDRGRKIFWEAWFRRLDTEVSHPEFGYRMSYRRMLEVQARQLWRFCRGEAPRYHGFTTR